MQFNIGKVPIQIHMSFLICAGLFLALNGLNGLLGYLLVMFFVVLHEFGHVKAAEYYGIGTRVIILTPLGGIAALDRLPQGDVPNLVISTAGPLVNLVIWILCAGLIAAGVTFPGLAVILLINKLLFLFNLLPIFPMDGGRITKALCGMGFGHRGYVVARGISISTACVAVVCFAAVGYWVTAVIIAIMGYISFKNVNC